jgi:hypothetical protein
MPYLIDRHLVQRANTLLLLSMVWAGLAACAIGATLYDLSRWLSG